MKISGIKTSLSEIKKNGLSMKRRLAVYIAILLCLFLVLIGVVLNLLGILNITPYRLQNTFARTLEETTLRFETQTDLNAAHALSFAKRLSSVTEHFLTKHGVRFEALENNIALIDELQLEIYNIIGANMHYADCSGAFFILNTTVNNALEEEDRSAVYLKFSYLHSQSMVNHQTSMLYGSSALSKEYGADYHSAWHLELPVGAYAEIDELFSVSKNSFDGRYILSSVYNIPDTWESVRFLCVPVFDSRDRLLGVCGFEISNLYFTLSHQSHDDELENIVHGLFTKTEDGTFVGQISGNQSGYTPSGTGVLTVSPGKSMDSFTYAGESFVGKYCEITLGENELITAVMVPEYTYENLLWWSYFRVFILLLAITLLMLFVCFYFSHKYMQPILKGFEHIKSNASPDMQIKIPEIDDLFRFLSEKDRGYEDEITSLTRLRDEAKDEYTKIQSKLDRVVDRHKSEVDPEFYEIFRTNLRKLTAKEREVFDLYLEGKSAKEIQETLLINPNTLKYHNKNIYSKLGVTSRKELLLYAAVLNQENFT